MSKLSSGETTSEIDRLAKEIIRGDLQVNEHLPSDEELSSEYGVSRLAMKKAKRELQRKGLIKHRRGKGYFVESKQQWQVLDSDVLRWHLLAKPDEHFLNQLFDIRIAFEPTAARLAAMRSSEAGIEKLTKAFLDMEACMHSHLTEQVILDYVEADALFHRCILENGGNLFLTSFNRVIQSAYLAGLSLVKEQPQNMATNLALTSKLYRAIRDRIPDKAEQEMKNLLIDAAQKMGCSERFQNHS